MKRSLTRRRRRNGDTHKTVKRVIDRLEAGTGHRRERRGANYDGVAELVAKRVKETSGRISAKRLLPAARAAGYGGSDPQLPPPGRGAEGVVGRRGSGYGGDHAST